MELQQALISKTWKIIPARFVSRQKKNLQLLRLLYKYTSGRPGAQHSRALVCYSEIAFALWSPVSLYTYH